MSKLKNLFTSAFPISAALLFVPLISQSQTARVAPEVNEELKKPLLVVADLAPGEYFAKPAPPAKCSEPGIVCIEMNPPPFSLIATVRSTIYGSTVHDKIELVTHSHYGMNKYEKGLNTVLVKMNTDGQYFFMPKYAEQKLIKSKKGELYILKYDGNPIWWLPCSVSDLKEEISSPDFDSTLEIPEAEYGSYRIEKFPDYYRRTANGVIPKYAISISKLSAHLNQINPTSAEMSCN